MNLSTATPPASAPVPATSTTVPAGRIDLREVGLHVGSGRERFAAVHDCSAAIAGGEFVCLLGPSGCGKSTLLNAVAGYLQPTAGDIRIDGEVVAGPAAARGMVFQQHSLFPWKTVLGNVAFGLKMKGIGARERRARALHFLDLVGLTGFAQRYPAQLSGGMQQRVEIARVLINQPRVVLMDEPFGALDAQTRHHMQDLLLEVWGRIRTTVLFVTHDIDEALFLGDRVLVMSNRPGRIRADIAVDLPRPRGDDLVFTADFLALKARCVALVREEAGRGLADAAGPVPGAGTRP